MLSVATAYAWPYTVIDIGTLAGYTSSSANAINATGQVTGTASTSSGVTHAFLYNSDGVMTDLGTLGGQYSRGNGINAAGQVTGSADTGNCTYAFLYSEGVMTNLGTLGPQDGWCYPSSGNGINDAGQVAGGSEIGLGVSSKAFLYSGGAMTNLGTLSGNGGLSHAMAINEAGQVTGETSRGGIGDNVAFLYSNSVMVSIGNFGGSGEGLAINNVGQVAGGSYTSQGKQRAFLYSNGIMTDLGTLSGDNTSVATGINDLGQVVGYSNITNIAPGPNRAFLYVDGSMVDLNALIDPASGWTLTGATSINNAGQIVGAGVIGDNQHAFLLIPGEFTEKNLGKPDCENKAGNPVNTGTGNKYQAETDSFGVMPFFSITRHYNSRTDQNGSFGNRWGLYGVIKVLSSTTVSVRRPDQQTFRYSLRGSVWSPDKDVAYKLIKTTTGWQLTTADDEMENYDSTGKFLSVADRTGRTQTLAYDVPAASGGDDDPNTLDTVTDDTGRQLRFSYDSLKRISTVTDPAGNIITYGYDAQNNLVSVQYPDGRSKTYHYNEPENTSGANLPHALTGITDENGDRYATYQYSADGKAISTGHAGGADLHTLSYSTTSTTVTDPLNTARTYNFTTILGVVKSTGVSQPGGSGCGAASSAITYDPNGNVASRADFNGHKTCYAYDLTRNLETARVEGLASGSCPSNLAAYTPAANSAERKILTEWNTSFRLPTKVTEAGRETTTVYDSHGNITSRSIKDLASSQTRTWTTGYTYHASVPGVLVQTVEDGPRIDVADLTTTDYYAPDENCTGDPLGCRGQVKQITNALGHVTTVNEYDANGRVLRTTDPNGLVTTFSYSPRGWLTSRTVGTETTSFDYDGVGQLTKFTRPDGSYVSFEYDSAHRLTAIVQQDGGRLTYTLDAMGNRIHEEITRPDNTYVYYAHSRTFDALGRLWQDIGAYNQTVTYSYDAKGNLTGIDGARTDVTDITAHSYDALDRLTQTLNADGGVVQIKPNAIDQTTQVVDPVNQATTQTVDAFGDVTRTVSADTGTTNRTYDEAGNLKSETDARNVTVTYSYDALNRLTQKQSSQSGSPVYTYLYDTCGAGRQCSTQRNGAADEQFTYDTQGRLASRLTAGTSGASGYAYRPGGQLATLTYPTGRSVTYSYDAEGRIMQVATQPQSGSPVTVLAHNFGYGYPFASPSYYIFYYGNGISTWGYLTQDYRPSNRVDGPYTKGYGYDPSGNITGLGDNNGTGITYAYDATGRLVSALDSASNGFGSLAWTYDKNGNRQSETRNAGTMPYTYSPPNWLYQRGSDTRIKSPTGNTVSSAAGSFGYDGYNRLVTSQTTAETTTYTYDALGQRIKKINQNGLSTVFHYGPNGELLFEQDQAGNTKAYVWLDGRPLARIDNDAQIYYYHVDHLGTPQAMTDASGTVVWKAYYDPFGSATLRVSTIENNLRLPGQYYDRETGLHYNYFRDYDPSSGRYLTADPIGLNAGPNVYAYVGGNPLSNIDPLGLWSLSLELYAGVGGGINVAYSNGTLELTGRLGVGLGGGLGYEPKGEPSPHSKKCGSGYIARTTVNGQAGVGAGPFGIGGSFTGASGNAVTTKVGGGYTSVSTTGLSMDHAKGFGARAGASVGVDIGSYSNWGDQQCGCQ